MSQAPAAHLDKIREMRRDVSKWGTAEVDSMGASALANYLGSASSMGSASDFRFGAFVATFLSPQTRDPQTREAYLSLIATVRLKNFGCGFTAEALRQLTLTEMEECIRNVSFYKTKARNLLDACAIIAEKHDNDVPNTVEELRALKGVGSKIAYLVLSIAFDKHEGICVDTHVHRIANRLGWVDTARAKSNGPEKTRVALQKVLPRAHWGEINDLLVGFGQTTCPAINPRCDEGCLLVDDCLYYQLKKK